MSMSPPQDRHQRTLGFARMLFEFDVDVTSQLARHLVADLPRT